MLKLWWPLQDRHNTEKTMVGPEQVCTLRIAAPGAKPETSKKPVLSDTSEMAAECHQQTSAGMIVPSLQHTDLDFRMAERSVF